MAEYYQIKSNLPIAGEHWGLEFTAGVAKTNDGTLAGKLMRKGYAVTCVAEPEEAPVPAEPAEPAKAEVLEAPAEPETPVEPEKLPEPPVPAKPAKAAPVKRKKPATKKG